MDKKNKMFTWTCGQKFRAYLLNDGRVKIQVYEEDYAPFRDNNPTLVPGFSFAVSVNTLKKLLAVKEWVIFGLLAGHEDCGCEGFKFAPEIKKIVSSRIGEFIATDDLDILEQKRIIRSVLRHVGA